MQNWELSNNKAINQTLACKNKLLKAKKYLIKSPFLYSIGY